MELISSYHSVARYCHVRLRSPAMVYLIHEVFEFEWFFEVINIVENSVHQNASACNLELSINFMDEFHWFCKSISPFTFMVASMIVSFT